MVTSNPRSTSESAAKEPVEAGSLAEPMLMEIALEVANQIGGIYTVLRSKVPSMISRWGSRYCLVGPYNPSAAEVEFEPEPLVGPVGQAVEQLREMGYRAHYGRWLVSGRPHAVLLDIESVRGVLNELKYRVWAEHGIASGDEHTVSDAVAFGEMCRALLSILAQQKSPGSRWVAHFHEWQASLAVPMLLRRDDHRERTSCARTRRSSAALRSTSTRARRSSAFSSRSVSAFLSKPPRRFCSRWILKRS